ncbi:MAG: nuclease-related domain-containing protein [Zymomonas mobilis]|uniref:nuclease-related domain-containing protein n=1 Tax=Zymomonas mobilis TaxID=542 RepID=UPI0001B704E4|nr:NERD domain protein [Zymomonas mobilis subsp. mobilis NCIMB 11163]
MFSSVSAVLFILLCALVPAATIIFCQFKNRQLKRRSPISEPLLPLPGETLQKNLNFENNKLIAVFSFSALIPSIILICLMGQWINPAFVQFHWIDLLWAMICGASITTSVYATKRIMARRKAFTAGLMGEMATAEYFTPLVREGWYLFHDLSFPRGNIDHVLVGPTGIFAIETKYRSKYADIKGGQGALAEYDGHSILFSGRRQEDLPLQQAKAVSGELSKYLRGKLGYTVPVRPVVSLPGWRIENYLPDEESEVIVINPKNFRRLKNFQAIINSPEAIKITSALEEIAKKSPQKPFYKSIIKR